MESFLNIFWLGLKEIRSLVSDLVMVLFVIYAFTMAIYIQATGTSSEVNNASLAFVDEDGSALSKELFNAFYPPRFQFPEIISASQVDDAMDKGQFMFVVVIPPLFESDLRAGRNPDIQVNIDATAMQQAGIGANYIKNIVNDRISSFLSRTDVAPPQPINLVVRRLFNPNGESSWFKSVVAIINQISLLTVVLTGAAVIREREHGTLEHLLVMPLTAFEIAMAKVWANGLVILRRNRGLPLLDCADGVEGAVRRFSRALVCWRRALSVFRHRARDIPRYDFQVDGAVRAFDYSGGPRAAASFGRGNTCRKPAAMAAVRHFPPAFAPFCQLFAGHYLSRRRH